MDARNIRLECAIAPLFLLLAVCCVSSAVHLNCGEPIAESVTLDSDIICPGSAILISADNVVLDCDGYQVLYSMSSPGDGITVAGSNVTIINCDIKPGSSYSNSAGVAFAGSTNSMIQGSKITVLGERGVAVLMADSDYNQIEGSVLRSEKGDSFAFLSFNSSSNEISNSTLETKGKASSAAAIEGGENNRFSGNEVIVRESNSFGVQLRSTSSGIVSDNKITVSSSSSSAVAIGFGSDRASITGNSMALRGDSTTGILVSNGPYASLVLNTINSIGSTVIGISAADSPSTQIMYNQVTVEGIGSTGLLISAGLSSNIDLNRFSAAGQGSTAVSMSNSSGCSIYENDVSEAGSEGRGVLLFSISDCSMANNTITVGGNEVALQVFKGADINITDNDLSSSSSSMTIDFSSGINIFRNIFNAVAVGDSRSCLFVNNSILGGSPKIITSGDTQLLLNDHSYGNYWGRESAPYFVPGVDVDNESFVDRTPLANEYGSEVVERSFLPKDIGLLISAILLLAFAVIAAYMFHKMKEKQDQDKRI